MVYLDWNATTPPRPEVLEAMRRVQAEHWGNPASVHGAGRAARAIIDRARDELASHFEIDAQHLIFTSGGSEANNLALWDAPALVLSRLEHPSVVRVAERLELQGRPVRWLPISRTGALAPAEVARALEAMPKGTWVAVMAANHETGVLQPIEEVAAVVRNAGARLHVDAVQLIGKAPHSAIREADRVSIAAHKLRGPKGIGVLLWRAGGAPAPLIVGGGQQRGLRPGTEDPARVVGLSEALRWADPARYEALATLRLRLETALLPFGEVNGAAPRLPHVTNISFEGWRADELVAAADLLGVQVSSGSACSAGTQERSPVIEAMLGVERANSAVRFSLGETTTVEDIDQTIRIFKQLLHR